MTEQQIALRYIVKFEKRMTVQQYDNETHESFIERIADQLYDDPNEMLDAEVLYLDDVEEM